MGCGFPSMLMRRGTFSTASTGRKSATYWGSSVQQEPPRPHRGGKTRACLSDEPEPPAPEPRTEARDRPHPARGGVDPAANCAGLKCLSIYHRELASRVYQFW